ncbi:MAG TPA: hypothetical protein VFB45_11735 [Pseudolabrys sp.]|nr:hypothetical protein [Pseudolabrys sp.]
MIAAVQAPGDNHKMQDGKILMINAYARRLLKLPEALDCVNSVRDLGPWFRDGAMWTRTNIFNQDGQTHVHFRDRATETSYRVTFTPLDRFVLISIIEIPG